MESPETLNSRTLLNAAVLGAVAAILVLLSGQATTAQTPTINQTDQQENESKLAERTAESIFLSGLRPPSVNRPQPQQNCGIGAGLPEHHPVDHTITGYGSRGIDCTSLANMSVTLKQDRRFWFDRNLSSMNGGGKNFELFTRYNCKGTGGQTVYTEVKSGKKKVQSKRVGVSFCG